MKKVTKEMKLAAILQIGSIEVQNTIDAINEYSEAYGYDYLSNEIQKLKSGHYFCYRFTPHDGKGDIVTINQVTDNPFTLIDLLCKKYKLKF